MIVKILAWIVAATVASCGLSIAFMLCVPDGYSCANGQYPCCAGFACTPSGVCAPITLT